MESRHLVIGWPLGRVALVYPAELTLQSFRGNFDHVAEPSQLGTLVVK